MTTKLSLFNPYEIDAQAMLLASHLPVGRVWQKAFKPDSNIGMFIRGLAVEFYRLQILSQRVQINMDINRADELLVEWEKSVGLPDSCFDTDVSIERRRLQVEQKFSKFGGVQTSEDFIRVAALFGYNIEIYPGAAVGTFPLQFPIVFFDSTLSATHTIFIVILGDLSGDSDFPLPFPIPFSTGGSAFLKCIFSKLAPANVNVVVINEGDL